VQNKQRGSKVDKSSEALVTLLFDENPTVAVPAMEQLLKNDEALKEILSIYQDSTASLVRKRIHQLSSVLSRRQKRSVFIKSVKSGEGSLINQLVQLASLGNPKVLESELRLKFSRLVKKLSNLTEDQSVTTERMVDFMRSEHFFVPEIPLLESRLYMLDMVLEVKLGSSLILACLAYSLGRIFNWPVKFVVSGGVFCLLDDQLRLIDPSFSWKVTQLTDLENCLPCRQEHLVYDLVSTLFVVASQDGEVGLMQLYGELLAELYGLKLSDFPYPMGDGDQQALNSD
jgi:hypothetical protein